MTLSLPSIKSYHIKLTKNIAKWAVPSSSLILDLMIKESCLIYFYLKQHKAIFHSFLCRSEHKNNFESKQIKTNIWVFCNKSDEIAMKAMAELPKLFTNVCVAPSIDNLIENGNVNVTAVEDTAIICKRYYKSAFFKQHQNPLIILPNKTGYTIQIVNFENTSNLLSE